MAQVIQDDNGIGSALGGSLGQGLGGALQVLAQNKLQNIMQRQQARQIAPGLAALGIPHEQAHQIALLPESLQQVILKNYLQGAESSGLDQALGQLSGEEVQPQNELPRELLQQAQPEQQKLSPFATPQDIFSSLVNPKSRTNLRSNAEQAPKIPATSQPQAAPNTNNLKDILTRPRLSPEHKLKIASLQQQRELAQNKLSAQEQARIDSDTKPLYDEIAKEGKAAQENNIRLARMETLIDNGELTDPLFATLFDSAAKGIFGVGIDLRGLENPDSQEFRKLSADFIKNAKAYFGNRLTDADLNAYLKTIPTLIQTDEGKRRVIRNLRAFNDIALYRKKAAADIKRKNGGRRPRDFAEQLDAMVDPYVERIAEDFKKNTGKPIQDGYRDPIAGTLASVLDLIPSFHNR